MDTWTVPATVVEVHDGDSVRVLLDLGWHITLTAMVRIDGLACAELSTPAGKAARSYAEGLLPVGTKITVVSKKLLGSTEKYGRILADVNFNLDPNRPALMGSYAIAMISAKQGVAWDGTGKQPVG